MERDDGALRAVAKRTPLPPPLGGVIKRLDHGGFRSCVTGQANAILLAPSLDVLEHRPSRISEPGRERRVCHAVRLEGIVVGNVHATNDFRHPEVLAPSSFAPALVDELAPAGRAARARGRLQPPRALTSWPGWSAPASTTSCPRPRPSAARVWPKERRRHNGVVLSDHAPVEMVIG